jgi:enamine deaminase RidA (YjgF/YER057c/UK114 family)
MGPNCRGELRGALKSALIAGRQAVAQAIQARLASLHIELPMPSVPGANYVPYVRCGNLLFISGQLCHWNGERRFVGKLGREFAIEEGQQAARLCALNLIAQAQAALAGDLGRVMRWVRIAGFVNAVAQFTGHSQVMNGASDLFVDIFGDVGRHTRLAVGVSALPYDMAVEIEAVVEVQ